jgi:hypothetical protein
MGAMFWHSAHASPFKPAMLHLSNTAHRLPLKADREAKVYVILSNTAHRLPLKVAYFARAGGLWLGTGFQTLPTGFL